MFNDEDAAYVQHRVFKELKEYAQFYGNLSFSVMSFASSGILNLPHASANIDTYFFSSMQSTLISIREILSRRRLNDSYVLLRSFYESIIINVYCGLYIEDKCSLESYVVQEVNDWIHGKSPLPRFEKMIKYILSSNAFSGINPLLNKNDLYKKIRDRCNSHVHFNIYWNLLLNDDSLDLDNRAEYLNVFLRDLRGLIIMHLSYIFTLKGYYMSSDDYMSSLECGIEPEDGSQYFVAPFVQDVFDNLIKVDRMDIYDEIKNNTYMNLG